MKRATGHCGTIRAAPRMQERVGGQRALRATAARQAAPALFCLARRTWPGATSL